MADTIEHKCPNCGAVLDEYHAEIGRCTVCGASMDPLVKKDHANAEPAAAPVISDEERAEMEAEAERQRKKAQRAQVLATAAAVGITALKIARLFAKKRGTLSRG